MDFGRAYQIGRAVYGLAQIESKTEQKGLWFVVLMAGGLIYFALKPKGGALFGWREATELAYEGQDLAEHGKCAAARAKIEEAWKVAEGDRGPGGRAAATIAYAEHRMREMCRI